MMCGPYWSQWDKSDLDSWMGKDYPGWDEQEDPDVDVEVEPHEECGCGNCMECLGMSERDFM